jgi:hypothetical protein
VIVLQKPVPPTELAERLTVAIASQRDPARGIDRRLYRRRPAMSSWRAASRKTRRGGNGAPVQPAADPRRLPVVNQLVAKGRW